MTQAVIQRADKENTVHDPYCGQANATNSVVSTLITSETVTVGEVKEPAGTNCRYIFLNQRALIADEKRTQIFSQFDYALNDKVEIFGEFSFSTNKITDGIGGAVLRATTHDGGFLVPASHDFNYFVAGPGNSNTIVWDPTAIAAGTTAVDVIVRQRPLTNADGDLAGDIERQFDNTRFMFGTDIELNADWSLNASYMKARSKFTDIQDRSLQRRCLSTGNQR